MKLLNTRSITYEISNLWTGYRCNFILIMVSFVIYVLSIYGLRYYTISIHENLNELSYIHNKNMEDLCKYTADLAHYLNIQNQRINFLEKKAENLVKSTDALQNKNDNISIIIADNKFYTDLQIKILSVAQDSILDIIEQVKTQINKLEEKQNESGGSIKNHNRRKSKRQRHAFREIYRMDRKRLSCYR